MGTPFSYLGLIMNMSPKAEKFLAKNPSVLGTVQGCKYYEHPDRGDEAAARIVYKGELYSSGFYEVPCEYEHMDLVSLIDAGEHWEQEV